MKLTCDLCGNPLEMNAGAQGATCAGCGMHYPMETLRQKLNAQQAEPDTMYSEEVHTAPVPTLELIIYRKFDLQALMHTVTIVVDGIEQTAVAPRGEVRIPIGPGEHDVYAIVRNGKKVESVLDTVRISVGQHNWYGEFYVRRTAWNAFWEMKLGEDINDQTRI